MGILSTRKNTIQMNRELECNYVLVKTTDGTRKHFFNPQDKISSLPHKPPKYFIRVNNKCIEDQMLVNIRGEVVELVPCSIGGS